MKRHPTNQPVGVTGSATERRERPLKASSRKMVGSSWLICRTAGAPWKNQTPSPQSVMGRYFTLLTPGHSSLDFDYACTFWYTGTTTKTRLENRLQTAQNNLVRLILHSVAEAAEEKAKLNCVGCRRYCQGICVSESISPRSVMFTNTPLRELH